ncbi:MAG: stage V sporulation protein AC [Clostridia bacterium]|nr:stage V sporulation protein AC [Clostridia bacterium]
MGVKMHTNKNYKVLVEKMSPKSPVLKNCVRAFFFGGLVCFLGQWLSYLFIWLGASREDSLSFVSISLIFTAALLTGLGFFDRIARFAGAGTLVPVTGFANSVVSPAIDTKSEGFILGVGAKIFTVAGPVIVYGILSGMLYGIIYFIYLLLTGGV